MKGLEITKEMILVIVIGLIILLIALYVGGFLTSNISLDLLGQVEKTVSIRPG